MSTEKENKKTYTILGIDPGTNVMGYGLLKVENKKTLLEIERGLEFIDFRSLPFRRNGGGVGEI
jgi:hypothetical protein